MADKYEDLKDKIRKDFTINAHDGIIMALRWLDEHPDQAPGRTLTKSDMVEAFGEEYAGWATRRLARIGYTIAPAPEPTNAEKLAEDLMRADAGGGHVYRDGHYGVAKHLADLGWTKAPGGGDD